MPFLFVGGRKKPFDNQMFVDDFRPRKRALHPCATSLSFAFSPQIAYILSITEPVARHVQAKEPKREFKVGDKIRVNLHHGKIEDAVVRAVIQDDDGTKLQVDVVGLDLTALIDTRQVVE